MKNTLKANNCSGIATELNAFGKTDTNQGRIQGVVERVTGHPPF